MTKVLYCSDVHIPYHDEWAVTKFLTAIKDEKPTDVVLGGDIIDFFKLSRFSKSPLEGTSFANEVAQVIKFVYTVRRLAGKKTNIYWLEGNHEERLRKYVNEKAPELAGWEELKFETLFKLESFNIIWVPDTEVLEFNGFMFRHGHEIGGASMIPGNNARKGVAVYGSNYIQGHIHRANIIHVSSYHGDFVGVENPCICGVEPDYVKGYAGWQQGWTILEYDKGTEKWQVRQTIL